MSKQDEKDLLDYDTDEANSDPASSIRVLFETPGADVMINELLGRGGGSDGSDTAQVVSEASGTASPKPIDTNPSEASVTEPMDVDKAGGDALVVMTATDTAPLSDDKVSLEGFGPHTREALKNFITLLRGQTSHRMMGKVTYWNEATRMRKREEVRMVSDDLYAEVIDSIFLDRNVRFKELSPLMTVGATKTEHPVKAHTSDPLGCACRAIHASVVASMASCRVGQGHKDLCEVKPFKIPKRPRTETVAPAPSPQPKVCPPQVNTSTSAHTARDPSPRGGSQGRGGRRDSRREQRGRKRKDRSSSSSHQSQKESRREVQGHFKTPAEYKYYSDRAPRQPPPPKSRPSATTSRAPETVPSVEQFKRLLSKAGSTPASAPRAPPSRQPLGSPSEDIRLRQPGHTLQTQTRVYGPPAATHTASSGITPAVEGESCLKSDGTVDWARIPVRPSELPKDVEFRPHPVDGVWKITYVRK